MKHDELLAKIDSFTCCSGAYELALRAAVELHKIVQTCFDVTCYCPDHCQSCRTNYPCLTIQAIEKELG